jgi:hypothetical protein
MTMARDGRYAKAMASIEEMTAFAGYLAGEMDKLPTWIGEAVCFAKTFGCRRCRPIGAG